MNKVKMGCQCDWVEIHINLQCEELAWARFLAIKFSLGIWKASVAPTRRAPGLYMCELRNNIGGFGQDRIFGDTGIFSVEILSRA